MTEIFTDIKEFFDEIFDYFKKNKTVSTFYVITIIIGAVNPINIFWINIPLHKSWIIASLFFTFSYTIIFHIAGFEKGYFENFGAKKTAILILTNILLFAIGFIISNEFHGIFCYTPKTEAILALITLCFFIYAIVNWIIYRHFISQENKEKDKEQNASTSAEREKIKNQIKLFGGLANDFKNSIFTSDLPITISFLFLFLYSLTINQVIEINHTTEMCKVIYGFEYFFYGAIAFQVMYSNAIWIFNDDKFFHGLKVNSTVID